MTLKCPDCGNNYESIGRHWSSKGYPDVSSYEHSILTGLLMGDAYINKQKENQYRIVVTSKSEKFLNYLCDDEIPWLFKDPYIHRTEEESIETMKNGSLSDTVNPGEYSDYYRTHSPSHPIFEEMRSWYNSGTKRFPVDLELNSTIVKYWYIGDGGLRNYNKNPFVEITSRSENDRFDWIVGLFNEQEFNPTYSEYKIRFPTDESERFLNWIGDPIPGYEYKWNETLKYTDCQ